MILNVLIVPIVVGHLMIHFLVIVGNSGSTLAPDAKFLLASQHSMVNDPL